MATVEKAPGAFKTIGEISAELGVAQHILRYWETKFPQLRPLQRAGNRRYYRPEDVELARRINRLLNQEGYTVRGVQKLLRSKSEDLADQVALPVDALLVPEDIENVGSSLDLDRLLAIRNQLASAIGE